MRTVVTSNAYNLQMKPQTINTIQSDITFQTLNANCLKDNPRIVDANFNPYNNPIDVWSVLNKDMMDMAKLFSTRFNRAHVYTPMTASKSQLV